MSSFLLEEELAQLGLKKFGRNVLISRYANFYSPENISIGDNVRIDDFCIISGNITIGSNVHISAFNALFGSKGIILNDYTGISPRCSLFSAMDDFSGDFLIGPIHSSDKTKISGGPIILEKYSQIGAHCIVFPNVTIGLGAVVGASSLVNKSLSEWSVYIGVPAIKVKDRSRKLLNIL